MFGPKALNIIGKKLLNHPYLGLVLEANCISVLQ
jgi:hypothetical protein